MNGDDDQTPVLKALPVDPGVTVKPATPAPAAPGPSRATLAPGAANQYQGTATTFADYADLERYNKDKAYALAHGASQKQAEQAGLKYGDNWTGTTSLGTVNTGTHYGVAVPEKYLRQQLGNDPAAWRTARAQVTYNGQTIQVPFIDVGPSSEKVDEGKIMDLSNLLYQGLGGPNAKSDDVQYNIVPNAGPDYLKDPAKSEQEQMMIANRFKDNPAAQAGPEPAPTRSVTSAAAPEPPLDPSPDPAFSPKLSDDQIRAQNAAVLGLPVQSFAKGGFVQPVDEDDEDDPAYHWPEH